MIFGQGPSFGRVIFGYIKGTRHRILSLGTIGEEISEKYILMNTCRGGTKRMPLGLQILPVCRAGLGAVRPVRVPTYRTCNLLLNRVYVQPACILVSTYLPHVIDAE